MSQGVKLRFPLGKCLYRVMIGPSHAACQISKLSDLDFYRFVFLRFIKSLLPGNQFNMMVWEMYQSFQIWDIYVKFRGDV